MATDLTELADSVIALVGRRDLSLQEFQDWLSGSANGGPNNDGYYPLTDSTGYVHMLPSPASAALNGGPAVAEALADATAALEGLEGVVANASAALAAGTVSDLVGPRIYSSRTALNADLIPGNGLHALVVGDATPANNDLYRKTGATGTGSWVGPLGLFAAASAKAEAAAALATTNGAAQVVLATAEANRAEAAAATLVAGGSDAFRGGKMALNAVDNFSIVNQLTGGSLQSSALLRVAKAFDAHATLDDDTNIKVNQLIGAASWQVRVPQNATHVRCYVYERDLTNVAPGGAGDTLIADTGPVATAAAGWIYNNNSGYGLYALEFPASQQFLPKTGKSYMFCLEFQNANSGNALVPFAMMYKQLPGNVAQRLAGFSDTTGSWVNQNLARPLTAGYGQTTFISMEAVKSTAEGRDVVTTAVRQKSLLRPGELLFAGVRPWGQWKYPGVTTKAHAGREGLANVLGSANWSAGFMMGQEGVDFGAITPVGQMTDLTTHAWYSANRFLINSTRNFNVPFGMEFKKSKLIGGYFDIQNSGDVPVLMQDMRLNANGGNFVNGVSQPLTLTNPGKLTMRNVTVEGYGTTVLSTNLDMYDCYLHFSMNDILVGGMPASYTGTRTVYVENTLMRRPADVLHPHWSSSAHSDIFQMGGFRDISLVGCVLYMAMDAGISGYDEGTTGATSALTGDAMPINCNGFYVLGCIIGGGQYNQYIGAGAGIEVKNYMHLNNIYLGGGLGGSGAALGAYENYNGVGEVLISRGLTGSSYKNIAFFGNICADGYPFRLIDGDGATALPPIGSVPAHTNGQPIVVTGGGTTWTGQNGNIEGIFNYDWSAMTDKYRELLLTHSAARGPNDWIVDPMSKRLNPKYNLGNIQVAGGTVPDTSAPVITSANPSASYNEGVTVTGTITATDATAPIVYGVEGTDASFVTINSSTGVWSLAATNYEAKTSYSFSLTARDSTTAQNKATQVVTITINDVDEIAPALSSPVNATNGSTASTWSVTTTEGNGTLYYYISTIATPPTAANLISGSGAVNSGSLAITTSGVKSGTGSGLTASTTYYTHFIHVDAAGNQSSRATAASFTTEAVSGSNVLRFATSNNMGPSGRTGIGAGRDRKADYVIHNIPRTGVTTLQFDLVARSNSYTGTTTLGNDLQYLSMVAIVNGIAAPVRVGGSLTWTVPDGQTYRTDALVPADFGLSTFPTGSLMTKAIVAVPAGGYVPWMPFDPADTPGAQAFYYDSSVTTLTNATGAGPFTYTGTAPTVPAGGSGSLRPLVLGMQPATNRVTIAVGDSNTVGLGDTFGSDVYGTGYMQEAIKILGWSSANFAVSGSEANEINTALVNPYYANATHGHIAFGPNDIGPSAPADIDLTEFQARYTAIITAMRAAGITYITVSFVPPRTTSTDQWASAGNQTIVDGYGPGEVADQLHAWLLSQVGTLIDAVVPYNSIRDAGNFFKWKSNGSALGYCDNAGLHLNTLASNDAGAEAAAVWLALGTPAAIPNFGSSVPVMASAVVGANAAVATPATLTSGYPPPVMTYEFFVNGSSVGSSYTYTSGNVGQSVYVIQTATNVSGTDTAQSASVTVSAAADTTPPTITSSATVSVAENSVLGHTLAANETVNWSIIGGADAADFEISGSTLRWVGNVTRDYEAPADADTNNTYIVTVRASDTATPTPNTADQTITVTVTNVAEGDTTAPVISTSSTATVAENATLAITLAANETVTWSIIGGTDSADFEISGTTLRWAGNATQNYESPADSDTNNTYVVTVRASDTATPTPNTADKTITVTVTDVTEGGGEVADTWDTSLWTSSPPQLVLSNGGKTVSATADIAAIRHVCGSLIITGKRHVELQATTIAPNSIGLRDNVCNEATGGSTGPDRVIWSASTLSNGSGTAIGATFGTSRVAFEIDSVAGLWWVKTAAMADWNGTSGANPATGTGGFDISALNLSALRLYSQLSNNTSSGLTIYSQTTDFLITPSAGFTAVGA